MLKFNAIPSCSRLLVSFALLVSPCDIKQPDANLRVCTVHMVLIDTHSCSCCTVFVADVSVCAQLVALNSKLQSHTQSATITTAAPGTCTQLVCISGDTTELAHPTPLDRLLLAHQCSSPLETDSLCWPTDPSRSQYSPTTGPTKAFFVGCLLSFADLSFGPHT